MKRLLFFVLFIFNFLVACSQKIEFRGKIIDKTSGLPLQGATVLYNTLGATANGSGYFSLTVENPPSRRVQLVCSHIGYKSSTVTVTANDLTVVSLTPSDYYLDNIIVTSGAEQIVHKAIKKIPDNYPQTKFTQKGILRFYRTETDSPRIFRYFKSDAVILLHYPSYMDSGASTKTEVLQNKNIFVRPVQPVYDTSIWTGSYIIDDFIHKRAGFINPAELNTYKYRIAGKTIMQGVVVWIVAFETKNRLKTYGTLFIDTATYAFVGAHYTKLNIKRLRYRDIKSAEYSFIFKQINNKWYPHQISQNTIFNFSKARLGAVKDYLCTEVTADTLAGDFIALHTEDNKVSVPAADSLWNRYDSLFTKAENEKAIHFFPVPKMEEAVFSSKDVSDEDIPFYKRMDYLEETRIRISLSAEYINIRSSSSARGSTGIGFGAGVRLFTNTYFHMHSAINFKDINKIYSSKLSFDLLHSINIANNFRPFYITPFLGFNIAELTTKKQKYKKLLQWSAGMGLSCPVKPKLRPFANVSFSHTFKTKGDLSSYFSVPFSFSTGAFFIF